MIDKNSCRGIFLVKLKFLRLYLCPHPIKPKVLWMVGSILLRVWFSIASWSVRSVFSKSATYFRVLIQFTLNRKSFNSFSFQTPSSCQSQTSKWRGFNPPKYSAETRVDTIKTAKNQNWPHLLLNVVWVNMLVATNVNSGMHAATNKIGSKIAMNTLKKLEETEKNMHKE